MSLTRHDESANKAIIEAPFIPCTETIPAWSLFPNAQVAAVRHDRSFMNGSHWSATLHLANLVRLQHSVGPILIPARFFRATNFPT